MLNIMRVQDLVFITLFIGGAALSAEKQQLYDGREVTQLGLGLYEYLGEEIFYGAFYGSAEHLFTASSPSTESVQKIQIRVLADFLSARRFNRLWLDAIALNSDREERNLESDALMAFGELLAVDLLRGDRIDFDYLPQRDLVVFQLNDVVYGEISGSGFYQLLLQGWTGPTPPSTQFKAGLMLQLDEQEQLENKSSFTALTVSPGRKNFVNNQIDFVDFNEREELARQARLEQERLAELAVSISAMRQQRSERLMVVRQKHNDSRELLEQMQQDFLDDQVRLSEQYEQAVSRWISAFMEYPEQARNRQIEGKVVLEVAINRQGQVLQIGLLESSAHDILDEAAMTIVNSIEAMPPIPERLSAQTYTVNIPFSFVLD